MSLEDLPTYLSEFAGINEFTAQTILSVVVIFALLLPVMFLARDSKSLPMISILTFFLAEAITIGLGWIPAWVMIATIVLMASGVALLGTKLVTGE